MIKVNGKTVRPRAGEAIVLLPSGVTNREVCVAARSVWTDGTGMACALIDGEVLKTITAERKFTSLSADHVLNRGVPGAT